MIRLLTFFLFSTLFKICVAQGYPLLREQAQSHFENNNIEDAVKIGYEALNVAERDSGKISQAYATAQADLGIFLYYNYDFVNGINFVKSACALLKDLNGEESELYAFTFSDLGSLYYMNEQYGSALEVFELSCTLVEHLKGAQSVEYGYELNKLGLAQSGLGKYQDAELSFFKAIKNFEDNGLEGSIDYASLYNNLGSLYQSMNSPFAAERNYLIAQKIYIKKEGKLSQNYIISLQNIGNLKAETGQYENVLSIFEEVARLKAEKYNESDPEYAKALNDLGNVCQHLGMYVDSEQYYLRSLKIKKEVLGIQNPSTHRTVNNLAMLYKELGRYDQAQQMLNPTLDFFRQQKNEDPLTFILYSQNMAELYRLLKQLDEAESLIKEAMQLQESISGKKSIDFAMLQHSFAGLLLEREKFIEARAIQLQVVKTLIEKGQEGSLNFITALFQSGMIELNKKEYPAAEIYLRNTLDYARKAFSTKNPELFNYMINLAQCLEKQRKYPEAEVLYLECMIAYQDIIQNQMAFMSAGERSDFLRKMNLHIAFFKAFSMKRCPENPGILTALLDIHINIKGMTLNAVRDRNAVISAKDDPLLTTKNEEWISLKNYLNKLYQLPISELNRTQINLDSLETRANLLEKELSLSVAEFSRKKPNYSRFHEIVSRLKHDEVAIEMIRVPYYGDDNDEFVVHYAALILTDSSVYGPDLVLLENGRDLDGKLSDMYYENIFSKNEDLESYNHFWKNVQSHLTGINKVYLSRDGIFNILNVNTLYNPQTQKYLIEELDIHYVGNIADIIEGSVDNQLPKKGEAHLFGYPDYFLDLQEQVIEEEGLLASRQSGSKISTEFMWMAELPGTKKETENINKILSSNDWKTSLYLNDKAGEREIKVLNNPDILHLATHGFFDFDNDGSNEKSSSGERSTNALLRSGIMLAGSSHVLKLVSEDIPFMENMEDGVLNGYEVLNLNLNKTSLVVLSACLTGVGAVKLNGTESYHGMLRAFLAAGADNVVASNWSADDEATMELMVSFYTELMKEQSIHKSFRNAQIYVKNKFPMPYYWGSFVLIGNH